MALIECPECDKKISETANSCPKCGYQFVRGEIAAIIEDEKKFKRKRRLVWGILIILFFASPFIFRTCDSIRHTNSNVSVPKTSNDLNPRKTVPLADSRRFFYNIMNITRTAGIKSSIEIMLPEKVSKNDLKEIAMELRNEEPQNIQNVFITYYLPGMVAGSGAWASSNFTPDLKIIIYGTTSEEKKDLTKENPKYASGSIIGEWLLEIAGAKYTFLHINGKIIMVRKFNDGSGSEAEMIQKKQAGKTRFEEKDGNRFGEYYIIEKNGNLASYDKAGLIRIMPSVKK